MQRRIQVTTKAGLIIVLWSGIGYSQAAPGVKQEAKDSPCANIVALAGTSGGNATINCSSLTPQQRKIIETIPSLLRTLLANQLDPKAINAKLDEIKALAERGSTSPEAVAEGVTRGLTTFQDQQQRRFQDAQNNPKTIAESSYTLLSKYLGMLQMFTPQAAGPLPDNQLLYAYHSQFDISVADTIERLQSRNVPVGDLPKLNKNVNSRADIERLENAFKQVSDSGAHSMYLRLATFLSRADRLTSNPPPTQFPSGQAIQVYRGSYANIISENLAKLQSQHIAVDDLMQLQNNLNSLADIQRLADGFKKLADSLK